jgi:hypothetical protein
MSNITQIKRNKKSPALGKPNKKWNMTDEWDGWKNIKDFVENFPEDEDYFHINYIENDIESYTAFNLQVLPHCCGVYEVGSLEVSSKFKGLSQILDGLAVANAGLTLIMNTNGRDASLLFEEALVKCKYWTKIKRFLNKNSGRHITVWMTNND